MRRPSFVPQFARLEDRVVPALAVAYNGESLALTGTPAVSGYPFDEDFFDFNYSKIVQVKHVSDHNYKVTDGTLNLGTYHVTGNISVKLPKFDTYVQIDVAGDALPGNVSVDLGAGDTDPSTDSGAQVINSAGPGGVLGNVSFKNGAGTEGFAVLGRYEYDEDFNVVASHPIDIGGNVTVAGKAVATPVEDFFTLDNGTIHGNLSTSRITYTQSFGEVLGDVTANGVDSPGGVGNFIGGRVHGNVSIAGGATAPGYFSYTYLVGQVDGDATVKALGGSFAASMEGDLGGNFKFSAGPTASSSVGIYGSVGGNAKIDLGGSSKSSANFFVGGFVGGFIGDFTYEGGPAAEIGGSLTVTSTAGTNTVTVGSASKGSFGDTSYEFDYAAAIAGSVKIDLGNGTNSFSVTSLPQSEIGGKVTYQGGSGKDVVTINGQADYALAVNTGGGDDTVAFGTDARVGSAVIDFGKLPGVKVWTPPAVIDFPLKLKNLT